MSKSSKKISAAPSWLGLTPNRLSFVFLPDRAETLRKIFQLAIGGLGSYAIASYLDEEKVPTFTGSLNWDHTTIDSMLRNRATYGEYQPKSFAAGHKRGIPSGPPVSSYYPAVIDKATFDAAQVARQQNLSRRGRKGNDLANIFGDLCSCAYCGSKVIFHRISNVQVLVCDQVLNQGACSRSAWSYSDFEITVLAFLAHPALLQLSRSELKGALLDLVAEIKGLSSDRERRYARRVDIAILLKRIVVGLAIHSAGNLSLTRHSSAQIRKDIAGRFLEIQLQGGQSYPCISIR
ncbi:recombinase family protein [Bradyrhizobium sp. WYCCWR 12699]|uniref:recombinase family protein n=1 Tax=Bradyrhizobium sp. WYCCWR 12699 TaxID=3064203 RepID=UPI0028A56221|nr:recombinase family protein [Bradyrhizobium sp. WYCCWR 12699]MDT4740732.1 recombinase family protein [Bradyrhizobium sp. WYCCWR 12699]